MGSYSMRDRSGALSLSTSAKRNLSSYEKMDLVEDMLSEVIALLDRYIYPCRMLGFDKGVQVLRSATVQLDEAQDLFKRACSEALDEGLRNARECSAGLLSLALNAKEIAGVKESKE